MVSSLKEQENFLRNAILTVDHSKEVLQCFLEQHLKNNDKTFDGFLNQNQHDIYHLYYDAKCCQCGPGPLQRKKRILSASQMELLFDKNQQLLVHKMTRHSDFCCCHAKQGVTTAILDLTLARCLLMNCCIDMFWYSCLAFKGITFEQFLNSNKHILYHLWKSNNTCCMCPADFKFPCENPLIMESEWKKMFSSTLPPCENDRKRPATGAISICSFAATPSITVQQIHLELQNIILKYCCSTRNSVNKLAELRNSTFGHVKKASMSCTEFNTRMSEAKDAILDIATVCGKKDYYREMLLDLRDKPLDNRMFRQYEKVLLQMISNYEEIIKNNEMQKDEIESLKSKIVEIEKLCKQQTEGSKRQRLIDQTSAEIKTHEKDGTYVEIEAVRHCIQLLKSRNVVTLSGREGSGKSRNGLEILRQLKEKNKDFDVFKLMGLHYVSDIVKCNVTSIVLFDDAFGRTSEHLSCDKQVLNHVYSYISQNKVKVIFTMRNSVRQACQMVLSTHKLFHDLVDIDLNSQKFKLTKIEKKKMLATYCDINKIMIYEGSEDNTDQSVSNEAKKDDNEAIQSVPDQAVVLLKRRIVYEIIQTDPFLGFPECCRLFTENRKNTSLDSSFFKWPSTVLVNDIEKLRMEGINNYIIGLKYVLLIYILTLGTSDNGTTICALAKKDINAETCKQIYNVCYNMNVVVHTSDIDHVCKVLTGIYLVYKDKTYCFHHKAIQDSVLISYSNINLKAIISLLSFDHVVDIVRPHNYTEQEDEIVIKISKPYYPELAKKIISILGISCMNDIDRFIKSTLIAENDIDLIYQLVLCIQNENDILHHYQGYYVVHFMPLYLLRNIGKLDDTMLTVNHTNMRMSISVTIGDKHITLSIDPNTSLIEACRSKYKDICIWLLKKNTDHSLLYYECIFIDMEPNEIFECTKMLLQNVKHSMIDMTQLLTVLCNFQQKNALDWMLNSVDNSSIDYTECINEMMDYEYCNDDMTIHLLKKVNHRWLNINAVVKKCCKYGCSEVVEWVLKNCDQKLFDYEELFKITIDGNEEQFNYVQFDYYDDCKGYSIILELLILQKPGIICCNINTLCDVAIRSRMNGVLELLFKHDINKSIHVHKIIENIFKPKDDEEQYNMLDFYENVYSDKEYCQKIIQLIKKYYLNYVNDNQIIKKAFQFGIDDIVELSLEKLDNLSYYLDITLDQLRHQQLKGDVICFDTGHGKILMLLLPRIDYKYIALNNVMNDVCHFGHSPAVLWLLENKPSYRFDLRNVMNKACYHGDLQLVEYLYQKYNKEDFDYKTAMLKACRNSQGETLDVCIWLWAHIDRDLFDMKATLNNASRCDNTKVLEWILTEVDTGLYDIEDAVLCACEHGKEDTLKLLLKQSGINMLDIQSAMTIACRNDNGLEIIKFVYGRANKSNLDINGVISDACKYYRTDIIQWIIKMCDRNITVIETSDGNKKFIECLDKNLVDIGRLITCILDMDDPKQKKEHEDKTKKKLILLILNQFDPQNIDIHDLLTESCKRDWTEIFQWIFRAVRLASIKIQEATSVACRNGAFRIVKWSLENIDANFIDLGSMMIESCAYGWLECLILMKKHFNRYVFDMQAAMFEACTYNRLHVAEWLLQNVNHKHFDIPLLLKEAGRNGWINIFRSLLQYFHFHKSDIQTATSQALENGQLKIAEHIISTVGKDCFSFSSLSENIYMGANKEGVVNFLLHNIDPSFLDIAKIMTNACLFGWKDIAYFIVDNDLTSLCDLSLVFNTACYNGELEIAQLLLEKVDPHILTTVDKAMHSVAVKGWDEIALLLLDKVKHTRLDIGNALIEACLHGEIDVVQAILRKVERNMLDVNTALNKACENHMHEELVLWILKNIDQEQVNLKTVKIQAIRHRWMKVQFAIPEVAIEDFNQIEQETGTDSIIISK